MLLLILLNSAIWLVISLFRWRFDVFKGRVPYIAFDWKTLWGYEKQHPTVTVQKAYDQLKTKGPICGLFMWANPFLVVTDVELARTVLIKEFSSFEDRGIYHNPKDDPVGQDLFASEGDYWRTKRKSMTTSFSSGKIKAMLPVVLEKCEELNDVLVAESSKDINWDLKNVLCRFTADVIGNVAFGLECDQLKNSNNSKFVDVGMEAFRELRPLTIRALLSFEFSKVARFFKIKRLNDNINKFYSTIVRKTISFREENSIVKEDLIGSMINMMKSNLFNVDEVISSSFSFFVAGFETTANTLNYAFYNLALYPELQEQIRGEVLSVLDDHNQQLTYEAVSDMPLVEKALLESLRRYSSAGLLFRIATKDFKVPDTNIVIKKGERLFIPVQAMQLDSTIYPDAMEFDIERDYSFLLSFGQGPRMCIGDRFAMVEMKIVLANFLKDYKIVATEKTPRVLTFTTRVNVLATEQKLALRIEKVSK